MHCVSVTEDNSAARARMSATSRSVSSDTSMSCHSDIIGGNLDHKRFELARAIAEDRLPWDVLTFQEAGDRERK